MFFILFVGVLRRMCPRKESCYKEVAHVIVDTGYADQTDYLKWDSTAVFGPV